VPHLQTIAREPSPVGAPGNARVRDYLTGRTSAMGLRPDMQKTTVFWSGPDEAGQRTNDPVREYDGPGNASGP
jgi:hypothetical protein